MRRGQYNSNHKPRITHIRRNQRNQANRNTRRTQVLHTSPPRPGPLQRHKGRPPLILTRVQSRPTRRISIQPTLARSSLHLRLIRSLLSATTRLTTLTRRIHRIISSVRSRPNHTSPVTNKPLSNLRQIRRAYIQRRIPHLLISRSPPSPISPLRRAISPQTRHHHRRTLRLLIIRHQAQHIRRSRQTQQIRPSHKLPIRRTQRNTTARRQHVRTHHHNHDHANRHQLVLRGHRQQQLPVRPQAIHRAIRHHLRHRQPHTRQRHRAIRCRLRITVRQRQTTLLARHLHRTRRHHLTPKGRLLAPRVILTNKQAIQRHRQIRVVTTTQQSSLTSRVVNSPTPLTLTVQLSSRVATHLSLARHRRLHHRQLTITTRTTSRRIQTNHRVQTIGTQHIVHHPQVRPPRLAQRRVRTSSQPISTEHPQPHRRHKRSPHAPHTNLVPHHSQPRTRVANRRIRKKKQTRERVPLLIHIRRTPAPFHVHNRHTRRAQNRTRHILRHVPINTARHVHKRQPKLRAHHRAALRPRHLTRHRPHHRQRRPRARRTTARTLTRPIFSLRRQDVPDQAERRAGLQQSNPRAEQGPTKRTSKPRTGQQ